MGYLLTQMFLYMLAAFLLGLLLGWLIWSRRQAGAAAQLDAALSDLDGARRERDALQIQFDAASREQGALLEEAGSLRAQLEACSNSRRALERQIAMLTAAPPPPPAFRISDAPAAPPMAAPIAGTPAPPRRVIDDLKKISGIGRVNEAKLNELGVTSFAQIAAWSPEDEARIGDLLAFEGRIEREEWVAQAKILARGGDTEHSQRVERGEFDEPQ